MKVYTVRIPKEDSLAQDLKIMVMEDGRSAPLGLYDLIPYRPWNELKGIWENCHYDGVIYCFRPGAGIPRMLIESAVSEMQRVADEIREEVTQHVGLFPKSLKLKKIYEEQGYEFFSPEKGMRVFTPQEF